MTNAFFEGFANAFRDAWWVLTRYRPILCWMDMHRWSSWRSAYHTSRLRFRRCRWCDMCELRELPKSHTQEASPS